MNLDPSILRAMAAQIEQAEPHRHAELSWFRIICGTVCAVTAVAFLSVNTWTLGKFGYRLGHDDGDKWSQAVVAGSVPWVLALLPFIMMGTWVPRREVVDSRGRVKIRRGRPSFGTLGALLLYAVFLFVNFVGGIGVSGTARQQVHGMAEGAAKETSRLEAMLADEQKALNGIPQHRPPEQVDPLISATLLHRFWKATDGCKPDQVLSKAHRDYCAELERLKGERGAGEKAVKHRERIAMLSEQLSTSARTDLVAQDSQAKFIAQNFNLSEEWVRMRMPLMWPSLLEIGSMFLAYYALKFFRVDHHSLMDVPVDYLVPVHRQIAGPQQPAGGRSEVSRMLRAIDVPREPAPPPGGPMSHLLQDHARMRAVFDEFWSRRMRRNPGSQTAESTIYVHYQGLCGQRNTGAFDLDTFRTLSAGYVRETVPLNGQTYYLHTVPCEDNG